MSQPIMQKVRQQLGSTAPKFQEHHYALDGHAGVAYTFRGTYGPQTFSISNDSRPTIYFFNMAYALTNGLLNKYPYHDCCLECTDEDDAAQTVADMVGECAVNA